MAETQRIGGAGPANPQPDETLDGPAAVGVGPGVVTTKQFPIENWDRYEFLKLVGEGGMGSVFQARDRKLGRIVALKFIRGGNQATTARFVQEARAQSHIDHPNICKVLETGEVKGKAYIAMQFIDAPSLDQAQRKMSLLDKVRVLKDVAEAMHAAHERGIVHRDIKPANIMIESLATLNQGSEERERYRPIIMDFGLARDLSQSTGLTETGAMMGTPAYMSPEQARGDIHALDHRADIYSLGATLHELLCGKPPFDGQHAFDVLTKLHNEEVPPLRQKHPDIPEALDIIVAKCLHKEAAQRYQSAKALADDLGRFLKSERIVARKLGLWYRLRYRARRNKPLAAVGLALLVSLVALGGYGIHTRVQIARKERIAQKQAELARQLGRSVEQLEGLARIAYAMPLHDTSYELGLIRQRMFEIERQMRSYGADGTVLADYALGRGYLALHDWSKAHEHLRRAQSGGFIDGELDYALGRVLGALYHNALEDARRSGDESFVRKRKKELEQEFLLPALAHLERSRSLKTVSASYVEGLIDYYRQHYDAALLHAQMARRQLPWQYEASQLEGDVYMARALDAKDHGDYDCADENFQQARRRYEQASEMGRSDFQLYESIAEVWVRQMEMDGLRRQNPQSRLRPALAAAERALEAAPMQSSGYTKKAYAYLFLPLWRETQETNDEYLKITNQLIFNGEQAVRLNPNDVYARDILGNGYVALAKYNLEHKLSHEQYLKRARDQFDLAISINPRFPWVYNDLGRTYIIEGDEKTIRRQDPTSAYLRAIEFFQKSIMYDKSYLIGHGSVARAYSSVAVYSSQFGKDPKLYTKMTADAAQAVLAINDKYINACGNIIHAGIAGLIYSIDSRSDGSEYAEMALANVQQIRKIDPDSFSLNQLLPLIHYLIARQQFGRAVDSSQSIRNGLQAVAACHRANQGPDGNCASFAALLWMLVAEKQQKQGLPTRDALANAQAAAKVAIAHEPTDPDVLLAVAEVSWRAASILLAEKSAAESQIGDGLKAMDALLAMGPVWPRARAVEGALYSLRARTHAPGASESLLRARAALNGAAASNPLLRNTYQPAFLEVESLTSRPVVRTLD